MHVPVPSPWLPGYINVVQTVPVILTMAGLFLDRPHMYNLDCGHSIRVCVYVQTHQTVYIKYVQW